MTVPNSRKSYLKNKFIPFVDERDHLGQLIDSDARTELGHSTYIKKMVVYKPRKHHMEIEIRDDIPRRWLDNVAQSSEGAKFSGRNSNATEQAYQLGMFSPGPKEAISDEFNMAALGKKRSITGTRNSDAQSYHTYQDTDVVKFDKKLLKQQDLVLAAKHINLGEK
jgi:hypothetical protein